jgi:large subunit ribosomal protein L10e
MGESKDSYGYKAVLIAQKDAQIRHNALEATRVATNRFLSENLGTEYLLRILPYPHVVLRENKMIFGAHADRLQDGMRAAFGKAIGTAARIKSEQAVLVAYVNENGIDVAKEALKRGRAKLPVPCRIIVEKIGD